MHFQKTLPALLSLCFLLFGASELAAQSTRGMASFYADRFHNGPTSTGGKFNNKGYMAASKELDWGTVVEVTNVTNGKKVNVQIVDCGPHRPDRIIDLSKAAAREIGILKAGLAEVQLRVILPSQAGPTCYRKAWSKTEKKAGRIRQQPPTIPAGLLGPVAGDQPVLAATPPSPALVPASRPGVGLPPPTVGGRSRPVSTAPPAAAPVGTPINYGAPVAPAGYSRPVSTAPADQTSEPVAKGNPPTAPQTYGSQPVAPPPAKKEFAPDEILFGVQVGAFGSADNAKKMVATLQAKGFEEVTSAKVGKVHRVFAGKFYFPNQAEAYRDQIREAGHPEATVRRVQ